MSKVQAIQTGVPDLPTEYTAQQQMVHGLRLLIAEDAEVGVLESVSESSVRRPASAMHNQPEEEADLGGADVFQICLAPSGLEHPRNIAP